MPKQIGMEMKKYFKKKFSETFENILRKHGYLKCDYGFACGRHWVAIDGKVIAQTQGDDCWLRDEDVHRLGYVCLDKGKHWVKPEEVKNG